MKIVVVGAQGRLGRALMKQFPKAHSIIRQDIASGMHTTELLDALCPDVILNAAAMCGVEACEKDPYRAYQSNAALPAALARYSADSGCLLIHFSTDYVFSGRMASGAWKETDEIGANGIYGSSKVSGEFAVRQLQPHATIFRISSLIGDDRAGLGDIIKQAEAGRGTPQDPVQVLEQICSPITTIRVAKTVDYFLQREAYGGIIHLGATQYVDKWGFARMMLHRLYPEKNLRVITGRLPGRPSVSCLDISLAQSLGLNMPTAEETIEETIEMLCPSR